MIQFILLGAVALIALITILAGYVKCPPDMIYIISGVKKQPRIITGRATLRIPFFERLDKIPLKLIQIDVKALNVPTNDFINVNVDAVANVRVSSDKNLIQIAAKHFLNQGKGEIAENVQQILEGNMREIIGQMKLISLVNDKQEFSKKIQENAIDDIQKLGLEIVNLNVQNVSDENSAIENLGVDNLVQIRKSAQISKAEAEKEIQVAIAKANEESNKASVLSKKNIAEQNKDLAIKESEFKIEQDRKRADADAAYEIQMAVQQKSINENQVEAEIVRTTKLAELKASEITLTEKRLDAEIKKKADADKYSQVINAEAIKEGAIKAAEAEAEARKIKAEAEKDANIKEAEGIRAKMEAEAAGIRAKLLAEAEGVKAKALAEAEGIEKKAEAQKKMGEASIVEMVMGALPQVAKEVSAPMSNISNITMYGDQTNEIVKGNTQKISQVLNVAEDALGINLKTLIASVAANKILEQKNTLKADKKEDKK